MRVGVIMYQTSLTKGQELVAQRMVKEFNRQGHQAYLITSVYHDQQEVPEANEVASRGYTFHYDDVLGVPVFRVKSHQENWPPRRIAFEDFVANLSRIVDECELDVLISHSTLWNGPEDTAKFVEWRRKQAKGGAPVRQVVFCHMSHFQEPSDDRYDLRERTFREAWNSTSLRTIMNLADFILVTTPYEKDQMRSLGARDSKILLFPGGIDVAFREGHGVDFRSKYSIPRDRKLITYLGTVEERKNAKAVIEIARRLGARPDIHFVIAGRLEGTYGKEVAAEAATLANVTTTGPVPDEELPFLVLESYLNINMSRSEALGLSQLEFMYSGVPVVTSGVGGQSWIVKDGVNGVVLGGPDDTEEAEAAIRKLSDHPNKRGKMALKAKKSAAQFTMSHLIRGLIGAVSGAISRNALPEQEFEPGEKVIEAWVKKGGRVAVTTRRLIIDTAKGGKVVVVPLSEIIKIDRRYGLSRGFLAAGAVASIALLLAKAANLPAIASLQGALISLANAVVPGLGGIGIPAFAILPLALSVALILLGTKKGYWVVYGADKAAFLPSEFQKAVRTVDQLVPKPLLFE